MRVHPSPRHTERQVCRQPPPKTGIRSRHLKRDRGRVMGQREHTHTHAHTHTCTFKRRPTTPSTMRSDAGGQDLPPSKRVIQICAQQSMMLSDHGGAQLVEEWGFGRKISQWHRHGTKSAPRLAGPTLAHHARRKFDTDRVLTTRKPSRRRAQGSRAGSCSLRSCGQQ